MFLLTDGREKYIDLNDYQLFKLKQLSLITLAEAARVCIILQTLLFELYHFTTDHIPKG
jgi:hypothetical protein